MSRPINPTMFRLLRDVSAGIRVLQQRDGVILSENQILERASNIVMGLIGNFRIESLELYDAADNDQDGFSVMAPSAAG